MTHLSSCTLALVCCSCAIAAEVAPAPAPAPPNGPAVIRPAQPQAGQPGPQAMVRPQGGRNATAFEVETCTIATNDAASLAVWAELAAKGYHVNAATQAADGKVVLILERSVPPYASEFALPDVVEKDVAQAAALREKLNAILAERRGPPRQPPAAPQVAPQPQPVPPQVAPQPPLRAPQPEAK